MHNTDKSVSDLRIQHSHRVPNADAQAVLRRIRQDFLNIAVMIDGVLPPSRERSCALTKLDEARMWACSAAVMGGEIKEELTINRPVTM